MLWNDIQRIIIALLDYFNNEKVFEGSIASKPVKD